MVKRLFCLICDQGHYIGFLRIIVNLPLIIQLLSIIKRLEKKRRKKKYSRAHFFLLFSNYYKSNIFFLNFTKLIKLIKLNIYRKKKKKKIQGPKESIHLTHPGSILGSSLFLWDSVYSNSRERNCWKKKNSLSVRDLASK